MTSMSYCRFQNTLGELRACNSALRDDGLPDSDEELAAAKRLVKVAREFIELADEVGGLTVDSLPGMNTEVTKPSPRRKR